jgi:hypothetical protein
MMYTGRESEPLIRKTPAKGTESARTDEKSGGRFVSVKEERVQHDVREDCHKTPAFANGISLLLTLRIDDLREKVNQGRRVFRLI